MNIKFFTNNIPGDCVYQVYEMASQPALEGSKIRIMPDVHRGKSSVVGFTGTLKDRVNPAIIGPDIGCGMLVTELDIKADELDEAMFNKLDDVIRSKIPLGNKVHKYEQDFPWIENLVCLHSLSDKSRALSSMGTLGGGNHFIELDVHEDSVYLIIHSGSRSLGMMVYEAYIKSMEQLGFGYLGGKDADNYLNDMNICVYFASKSRSMMRDVILKNLDIGMKSDFETIHNYIEVESRIVRKGAISAKSGELVLIPMNMRDGCLICEGLGNEDWNFSAPHGAGRVMSRRQAKEVLDMDAYRYSMKGIHSTCINSATLNESPMVYKPQEEIINNIGDTVVIKKRLKSVYNFKSR